jgi:hypothetical protein
MTKVRELTLEQAEARLARQSELASRLYEFVYSVPLESDDEQYDNYMADADEILTSHPHLLPLNLRDDEDNPEGPNLPPVTVPDGEEWWSTDGSHEWVETTEGTCYHCGEALSPGHEAN